MVGPGVSVTGSAVVGENFKLTLMQDSALVFACVCLHFRVF